MSFTFENTFNFLDNETTFDPSIILEESEKLGLSIEVTRNYVYTFRNLPTRFEYSDAYSIKTTHNSHQSKQFAELVKLIPKPYEVVAGDDLEGEWLSTTTIVE